MRFARKRIVLNEVPNEISLCYEITCCPYECEGCHSPELRKNWGTLLTADLLNRHITENPGITCVCFLSGDQFPEIYSLIHIVKERGLKVCLYTGSTLVKDELWNSLTYIKIGPYIKKYGGLNNPKTNQKFIHIPTKKDLTHLFHHDSK